MAEAVCHKFWQCWIYHFSLSFFIRCPHLIFPSYHLQDQVAEFKRKMLLKEFITIWSCIGRTQKDVKTHYSHGLEPSLSVDSLEGTDSTLKSVETPSINGELKSTNWNIASVPETVSERSSETSSCAGLS